MLINEFDLELDIKPKKKLNFYWLQERNKTKDGQNTDQGDTIRFWRHTD
jgi:hypothetical protein